MTSYRVLVFVLCVGFVYAQSPCHTPSNHTGQCISIMSCSPLLAVLTKPGRTSQEVQMLRDSHCGYEGSDPKVCCPGLCRTPDGQPGSCINVYTCPHITKMLIEKPSPQYQDYVKNSICQGPDPFSVCCGATPNPPNPTPFVTPVTPPSVVNGACTPTVVPPTPGSGCCGADATANNRIIGGNETSIDQYPWLVILEYRAVNGIQLLCGGAIISSRYILTAAHCVVGLPKSTRLANVRIGEYNIRNDGPDCAQVEGGGEDCTDGAVIVPVDRAIPHPGYGLHRRHDIALVRLSRSIEYTDFIQPVCLPATDILAGTFQSTRVTAAGWGATDENHSSSTVKLHVDLPLKSQQDCQASYHIRGRNYQLSDTQFCAGGVKDKDTCKGDSGGPLMYENGRYWEVLGVVSFGVTPCGTENVPGVYTKVFAYKSWISDVIGQYQ